MPGISCEIAVWSTSNKAGTIISGDVTADSNTITADSNVITADGGHI